jgi:hypothetical protein
MRSLWKRVYAVLAGTLVLSAVEASDIVGPSSTASVEIVDRTEGRVLPVYSYGGRRYVVGKPGNEYAIRVRNTTGDRILAVMSVDGVNVITGDTAAPSQSGYVLSPNESYDIAGWRKSMSRTAAFYFTALADSYAARTGRPDNVGVIGVAMFRERARPRAAIPYGGFSRNDAAKSEGTAVGAAPPASAAAPPAQTPSDATSAQAMRSDPAPSRLGTGHGRNEESHTTYTNFARMSDTPNETIAFYYDSYANLLAQGVPVGVPPLARMQPDPDPFPDRGRFTPDPR